MSIIRETSVNTAISPDYSHTVPIYKIIKELLKADNLLKDKPNESQIESVKEMLKSYYIITCRVNYKNKIESDICDKWLISNIYVESHTTTRSLLDKLKFAFNNKGYWLGSKRTVKHFNRGDDSVDVNPMKITYSPEKALQLTGISDYHPLHIKTSALSHTVNQFHKSNPEKDIAIFDKTSAIINKNMLRYWINSQDLHLNVGLSITSLYDALNQSTIKHV